jgi:hypothetical protein
MQINLVAELANPQVNCFSYFAARKCPAAAADHRLGINLD